MRPVQCFAFFFFFGGGGGGGAGGGGSLTCNFVDISLLISVSFRVSRMKDLDYIMIADGRRLSLLIGSFWDGWGKGGGGCFMYGKTRKIEASPLTDTSLIIAFSS